MLRRLLVSVSPLKAFGRVNLRESLSYVWLALWDEETERLVSFADAKALIRPVPAGGN